MKITKEIYDQVKAGLKVLTVSQLQKEYGISGNSIYRIKKSKSYTNYRNICKRDGRHPYNVTTVDDILNDSKPSFWQRVKSMFHRW